MITFFHFKRQGRNNSGRITVRHRGAGLRFFYPNYAYKKSVYKELVIGSSFINSRSNYPLSIYPFVDISNKPTLSENRFKVYFSRNLLSPLKRLFDFQIGQKLCDIEITPGSGPVFSRAFGTSSQLLKKRGTFATLKIASGEIRRVSVFCFARLFNSDASKIRPNQRLSKSIGTYNEKKAGFRRLLGVRPHVRGSAMNPVDHPHGGRTGESRPSVSPWAQLTKGYRTRFKPINKKFVLLSVQKIKDRIRSTASHK